VSATEQKKKREVMGRTVAKSLRRLKGD